MGSLKRRLVELVQGTRIEAPLRRAWYAVRPAGRASYLDQRDLALVATLLERTLRPESCCIDIGAHKGAVVEHMMRVAPRGTHMAFEPIPSMAAELRERYPTVEVLQVALSDREGEAEFNHVVNRPGHSGLKRYDYGVESEVEVFKVPVRRLDDLVPPGRRIALVKIDVEGAELAVFRGARGLLTRDRPTIVFEFERHSAASFGATPGMMFDTLVGEHGYTVAGLSQHLRGKPGLSRDAFIGVVESDQYWNFVARPEARMIGAAR